MVVAHKSSSQEIGVLRKLFIKYDIGHHGDIAFEDFCESMKAAGHSTEKLNYIFNAMVSSPFSATVQNSCPIITTFSRLNTHVVSENAGHVGRWYNPLHGIHRRDY